MLRYDRSFVVNGSGDGMRVRHIGLIGVGAIGRNVVARLSSGVASSRFTILRRTLEESDAGSAMITQVANVEAMIAAAPDVVVEVAGHHALQELVPRILEAGISVIAASAGSLVQDDGEGSLAETLQSCAAKHGARLIVPAGAIGGLDYLAAVAPLDDLRIEYTSRKPPNAWLDELAERGLQEHQVEGELVLFEGSVAEAARLYPRNLNVAATIALTIGDAGRIRVRVVIDSRAAGNTHEIESISAAGRARFEFINAPAPSNPKTSMVTALSVAHCVEAFFVGRVSFPPGV
ncbi:MAG: aspartate dehydrogenase [Hyphomicrobiales bacterium]|nr:aspartate dehydrogenase [Hyphomicrobiales bacterium]